jgi:hypothetical protein
LFDPDADSTGGECVLSGANLYVGKAVSAARVAIRDLYLGGEGHKTGVVSIEELPETPETIWLRVLGRGETQKRAVEELQAIPKSTPMRYQYSGQFIDIVCCRLD